MDPLLSQVLATLEDIKANEIVVLSIGAHTRLADHMVICSGRSQKHVQSIANRVITECKEKGFRPLGEEGMASGEWVLIDLNNVIVHVMSPESRAYYQLEKLWSADTEPVSS